MTALPETFSNLQQLQKLSLQNNQLTALPETAERVLKDSQS